MSFQILTPHTFLNAKTSATASKWYPINYRCQGGDVKRTIFASRVDTNDSLAIETKISADSVTVTATATILTSANPANSSVVLQGAYTHLRVRKIGTSGAATINGIV